MPLQRTACQTIILRISSFSIRAFLAKTKGVLESQLTKIRLFLPLYLAISAGVIVTLASLRWLLEVHWNLVAPDEDIWELWIPLVAPVLPVLVWLRPRLKRLKKYKYSRRNSTFVLSWLAVVLPTIVAVHQVPRALGELVSVNSLAELNMTPDVRFVEFDSTIVDVSTRGEHVSERVTYRRSRPRNYYMNLHYASPFVESPEAGRSHFWQGTKFVRRIRASVPDHEKRQAFERLRAFAGSRMIATGPRPKSYYEVVPPSDNLDKYRAAIASVASVDVANTAVVLEMQTGRRPATPRQAAIWTLQAWIVGTGIFLLSLLVHRLKKPGRNKKDGGDKA